LQRARHHSAIRFEEAGVPHHRQFADRDRRPGYTTDLDPGMTLGCGSYGGNITSDNIGPVHLMNIKRVAWETKPLAKSRDTSAWRPSVSVKARSPRRISLPEGALFRSLAQRPGARFSANRFDKADDGHTRSFRAEIWH